MATEAQEVIDYVRIMMKDGTGFECRVPAGFKLSSFMMAWKTRELHVDDDAGIGARYSEMAWCRMFSMVAPITTLSTAPKLQ